MSENRNEVQADAFALIRHLWRRRYVLLVVPPIVVVVTYLLVRQFGGETFESSSLLKIRTQPSLMRTGPRLDDYEPPVYENIFSSDELIMEVIEAAREKYPGFAVGQFEKQKKAFVVEIITMRETIVVAEYSPVFRLSVRAGGRDQTYFLAKTWLDLALKKYGQLRSAEALEMRKTFEAEYERNATAADALQGEEARLQQELIGLNSRLNGMYRLLNGAGSTAIGAPGGGEEGLVAQRVRLELDLAAAEAADTEGVKEVRARLNKLSTLLDETNSRIEELSTRKVQATRVLEQTREELLSRREQLEQLREVVATTTPDSMVIPDPLNPEIKGEFSVLAWPVKPEKRIAPPRSMIAVGTGVGLGAFLLILVLAEFYIRAALAEKKS